MLSFISAVALATTVEVQGLLKDAAVISINGKPVMLRSGETRDGVTLISADSRQAIVEINGARESLGISQRISSEYTVQPKREVAISRNSRNAYTTYASVNGRRFLVLVDTGANQVAMSARHARDLGLDYLQGEPRLVNTASGQAQGYQLRLRSVDVGGITVSGVSAIVVDGDFPQTMLLGMTYLEHVQLREEQGTLYLQSKF